MNKYFFLSLLLAFVAIVAKAQDELKTINVAAEQEQPVETQFDCCRVFVTSTPSSTGEGVRLTVELENSTNEFFLMLFKQGFSEKALKKQRPSVRFDRRSYGASSRMLELCQGLDDTEPMLLIDPAKRRLLNFDVAGDGTAELRLPIYVAKYKKKKFFSREKYLIIQKTLKTLKVKVASVEKTDDFTALQKGYDDLMSDLKGKNFCPNRKHTPNLKKQMESYTERVEKLLEDIDEAIRKNNWRSRSDEYKKCNALKKDLEKLTDNQFEDYQRDCGRHGFDPGPHKCSNDDLTVNQLSQKMSMIYMRLHQGKLSKNEAVSQANALKNAWSGGCPKLTQKMKNDNSGTRRSVEGYYQDIINH